MKKAFTIGSIFLFMLQSINGKGYIGTGFTGTYSTDWWEWDPATNVWTQKANYPGSGIVEASAFNIGDYGYVLSSPTGNDFWRFDPATNSWSQMAPFAGAARQAAVAFAIDSKGYITTGASPTLGGSSVDLWEYNTATDSWQQMADLPGPARHYACGFSIGSKGYVGTGSGGGASLLNDFWAWDQNTNTWSQMASFPGVPRREASAFSIGNLGYMGMGSGFGTYHTDFYQYNPATNSWTQKASYLGGPREEATQFSIGPYGYVGTGYDGLVAGSMMKDFWEYHPEDSTTGVNDLSLIAETVIAPNPFHTSTTVSLKSEGKQIEIIRLFDAGGNLILSKAINDRKFVLDRNGMASGFYYLEITFNSNQTLTRKLIIE
jgi:N-acetylneuraminic acid mutarotase